MRTFTADSLKEIAFPLGGIGTGTVSLGGRGHFRDWEIFNRPGKGQGPAVHILRHLCGGARAQGNCTRSGAQTRSRRIAPDFGLSTGRVSGLPRLNEATFYGEYPFARIEFHDDSSAGSRQPGGVQPVHTNERARLRIAGCALRLDGHQHQPAPCACYDRMQPDERGGI